MMNKQVDDDEQADMNNQSSSGEPYMPASYEELRERIKQRFGGFSFSELVDKYSSTSNTSKNILR